MSDIAKKSGRKKNLIIFTLILLVIALVLLFLYLTKWRYEIDTEDAYVGGNQIQITSQISGTVASIGAEDTDVVKLGQTLITLDEADNLLALENAKNQLRSALVEFDTQSAGVAQADTTIASAKVAVATAQAQIQSAKVALQKAQSDYARRLALVSIDAVSKEELAHAKTAVDSAKANLDAAVSQEISARSAINTALAQKQVTMATLGSKDVLTKPSVKNAITAIETAYLNLSRTQIVSPISGQVAKKTVQIGQKINAGTSLMTVIPLDKLWVDANFKESQLQDIRVGQAVTLHSDLYGDDVVFHGKVIGLSAGTGSAFSVLPAQNATGNWIKVTQRVPVRIELNHDELAKHPLRIGLSMKALIDSRDHEDSPQVAVNSVENAPIATLQTTPDMSGAKKIIDEIIGEKFASQK